MKVLKYLDYVNEQVAEAKIRLGKGFYAYTGGEYVRQKLATKHGCKDFRYIRLRKPGRLLLLCIRDKPGLRGGRTKAIALLRDKDIDLRTLGKDRAVRKAIKRFRKFVHGTP